MKASTNNRHIDRLDTAGQATLRMRIESDSITPAEIRSIVQLWERSGDTLEDCIARVIRRRPKVTELDIVIRNDGSVWVNGVDTGKVLRPEDIA